jgi:multiple sugar transport system ATP-binding protein
MASVTLENLLKNYGDSRKPVIAVNSINLEIRDREFMVLVGPSGCGKSTSLRMIAGLEDISGGRILIGDRVVNDVPPKDRDIAMVFQNYALYPHMTVFDNMAFGLKLKGHPKTEILERVREAAAILGIEEYLDRKPKALSGGQRQRVAVGRAIVRNPKVFLFDEPLSNLDAKMRIAMRTEISKLHDRLESTMIYVTHDQVEAMTMGDRICVMRGGNIMQVAEPLEIYNHPANMFVAGFIGSPPMNFFHGTVEQTAQGCVFSEKTDGAEAGGVLQVPLDGRYRQALEAHSSKEVVLGIRPEEVVEAASGSSVHLPFSATVEVSEPMGAETFVYLRSSGHSFIARVRSMVHPRSGDHFDAALDVGKIHFFDPQTEALIVGPE